MESLVRAATALVAEVVSGEETAASSTTPSTTGSVTSSATDATWTNPLIASLWSDADSLISSVYPSSSITNVASLTWPSSVVIGSSTYAVTPGATTLSTSASSTPASAASETHLASNTNTATSKADTGNTSHTDKRLGIGLGVGIGAVALGVLIFLVMLLHRRKKRTGTFTAKRANSPSDDEIQAWRGPSSNSLIQYPEKYAVVDNLRPPMPHQSRAQPMSPRNWGNGDETRPSEYSSSSSDGNPFLTPYETYAELSADNRHGRQMPLHELHGESSMQMLNDRRPPSLITSAAMSAVRPSTPHTTALMRDVGSPVSPISPVDDAGHHGGFWAGSQQQRPTNPYQQEHSDSDHYESGHQSLYQSGSSNPFLSEEDNEEDDVLGHPPSIPSRSPNRRSSPVVHYPSGDELSTFNFGLHHGARRAWAEEGNADGGDGWRQQRTSRRESTIGRHEMDG